MSFIKATSSDPSVPTVAARVVPGQEDPEPSAAQVRKMASDRYTLDFKAITNTQWFNGTFKDIAIQHAKESKDICLSLLEAEAKDLSEHKDDEEAVAKATIELWKYVRSSCFGAYTRIKTACLRYKYMKNVHSMSQKKLMELTSYPERAQEIAAEVSKSRNAILEFARGRGSPTSIAFSKWLKVEGKP